MTHRGFWNLIEATRPPDGSARQHVENLRRHLAVARPRDVVSFAKIVAVLAAATDTDRVREVLYILSGGGPGDDCFAGFQDWLILRGEDTRFRLVHEPERLPREYPPGTNLYDGGGLASLAATVLDDRRDELGDVYDYWYDRMTREVVDRDGDGWAAPADEAGLRRKYPGLWERYFARYD